MTQAIYNEIEPFAAAWMRNLITAGHIAPGVVDERSILELEPADLTGPGQRHFFAGIGVWSHALRLAGVADNENIWTGSCPCQPFSAAGNVAGFADERHLWPIWFGLIAKCRPSVVFGEQVASPDGLKWLDLVRADLEGAGYAFGAADLCAAGVGAPHIRQRLYFVAHADVQSGNVHATERQPGRSLPDAYRRGAARELADSVLTRRTERRAGTGKRPTTGRGDARKLGDARSTRGGRNPRAIPRAENEGSSERSRARRVADELVDAGATHWSSADWIHCTDGKARPVEPGTFPLAHGAAARVGRLRAYGNAIVPQVAATFIRAALDI